MNSIRVMAIGMMVAVSAFVFESCSKEGPIGPAGADGTDANAISAADQAAYDAADGTIGARLFDHVLNQIDYLPTAEMCDANHSNFFRCKSCHGWDLRGRNGVLINKTPTATYPVAADVDLYIWARNHNIREIFDAVKNIGGRPKSTATSYNSTMPDYSQLLTDAQIWQLVKFLKSTSHNVFDFYDMSTSGTYPTGTKTFSNIGKGGNAANGKVVYDAKCAMCHGADGKDIDIYCQGLFLGEMFRQDPHEIQHKAVWGMPNDREHITSGCFSGVTQMPQVALTDQEIKDLLMMGRDTILFPNGAKKSSNPENFNSFGVN